MKYNKVLILSFLAAFFVKCSDFVLKSEFPVENEVKSGQKFKIILPENHTKGENWQLLQTYDKTHVKQVNEVWHGNEKGIYFHLKALSVGQTTLSFVKRKYTDTLDIKRFVVKIKSN